MLEFNSAICYSGYRPGQNPGLHIYPSYAQVLEDLKILQGTWRYLRMYDAGPHAQTVLEVIRRERLPFKVLLGMDLAAEQSNPDCPWGAYYSEEKLHSNRQHNDNELQRALYLLHRYQTQICGISIGNEAFVDWTDHKVPLGRLLHFASTLKETTDLPVTFCENYVPWMNGGLDPLADVVDFISLHSYPLWESIDLQNALDYTEQNYQSVKQRFSDKPVLITEAGWTSSANGRGFPAEYANEAWQAKYCKDLVYWSKKRDIVVFLFEAFDESWKGSPDPLEPEKHWGIYRENRTPKQVVSML